MYIILVYDVNKKRVSKIRKICLKYLNHVQNSVFEGTLTIAQEEKLKKELQKSVDIHTDKICIYHLNSLKYVRKEEIGKTVNISDIIE